MILGSGGAALNEHVIKPMFEVPRPNIAYLAGSEGSGPLGMPASAFYALEDEDARRESLRAVLEADPPVIRMHHLIREHWIEETGYSFPSGHSFSAMFIATFFLAMGLTWFSLPRLLPFYLLLPWAVCVSYSRPMLWLHTPADIAAGGLEGLVLGVVAYVLARGSLAARLGIRSGGALATQRR
jgi:phosphatidylglycerophosphatase B